MRIGLAFTYQCTTLQWLCVCLSSLHSNPSIAEEADVAEVAWFADAVPAEVL